MRHDRVPSEPWSIQIVRFERTRTNLQFHPTLGLGNRLGLGPLTEQVKRVPHALGTPLAAINGDFYATEGTPFPGDPRGLFIADGELVSAPTERACFWLDPQGEPHLGVIGSAFTLTWPDGERTPLGLNENAEATAAVLYTAAAGNRAARGRDLQLTLEPVGAGPWLPLRVDAVFSARVVAAGTNRADQFTLRLPASLRTKAARLRPDSEVVISTQTTPALPGVKTALGGGPVLVRAGQPQASRVLKARERHPRSALGWNASHFFLVVVDGRQPDHSVGMTLDEWSEYLARLGCTEALNLDGGGSTELWLRGRILNRPCYGHERRTATGLVVLERTTNALPTPAKTP